MEIKAKTVVMEMDGNEAYNIAWALVHDMRGQIKDHWNQLQQDKDGETSFNEQNKFLIDAMKRMFEVSGYSHCYESAIQEFRRSFEAKRKELAATIKN